MTFSFIQQYYINVFRISSHTWYFSEYICVFSDKGHSWTIASIVFPVYTTNGQQCHFPFTYDSESHYGCVTVGEDSPWCGLVATVGSSRSDWGFCSLEPHTTMAIVGQADTVAITTVTAMRPVESTTSTAATIMNQALTTMGTKVTTMRQAGEGNMQLAMSGVGFLSHCPPLRHFCEFFTTEHIRQLLDIIYGAGVAVARLRWHLSNVNVIQMI